MVGRVRRARAANKADGGMRLPMQTSRENAFGWLGMLMLMLQIQGELCSCKPALAVKPVHLWRCRRPRRTRRC